MSRLFKFKQHGKREPAPIVEGGGYLSVIRRYAEQTHSPGVMPPMEPMEFVLRVVPMDFKQKGEWGLAMTEEEAMVTIERLMHEINLGRADRKRHAIEKFKQEHSNG